MESGSHTSLVFVSLLLTGVSLFLVVTIVGYLFSPLRHLWYGFVFRLRFASYTRRLQVIDEYIGLEAVEEAERLLEKSLYIYEGRCSVELLEQVLQHNLGVLARVVLLAERKNAQLRHLPLVEGLVQGRHELLVSLEQLRAGSRRSRSARVNDSLDSSHARLLERLTANRRGLLTQFKELLGELEAGTSEKEGMIIH